MFTLDQVVPWGRSFDEYRRMFALTDDDLQVTILGCGDGPASFNAVATRRGGVVVSCDPIYRYDVEQIRARIASTSDRILEQTRQNAGEFIWTAIRSVDELRAIRMAAMDDFLDDYVNGKSQGRYIDAELPKLPFPDSSFGLALCSHFLFLYTVQLGEAFHRLAVREMCRVAREVRIFPLLALGATPSPLVAAVVDECASQGFAASIERVPYEFQRGGNEMMRIRSSR
jgi:SAM-dependent methyltransferase